MKTPMDIYNTAMKKKKNRKGFSLVELIVVLVIMAILAAALVPTLIGYIKQTKQSNTKNECASAVTAAQTIISSAYADSNNVYNNQSDGDDIKLKNNKLVAPATDAGTEAAACSVIATLAEVDGTVSDITIVDGTLTQLKYTDDDGSTVVTYKAEKVGNIYKGSYEVG